MDVVKPKILKGFRDFLPEETIARERIISLVKDVYESYGFAPLTTPALEYKEILLGYGEEASKQIYLFNEPDGSEVGLRFDLTVPLSRVIAQYKNIPRPFKRYQIQPVWRYDKPDPGRFREFIQFDIDTVGTDSMAADAEIISAMHYCLVKLGLNFKIRFNNRKVLNSLICFSGIDSGKSNEVLRVVDKLEKQGLENVKLELGSGRTDSSGDEIRGLGLDGSQISKIEDFLLLTRQSRAGTVETLRKLFKGVEGVGEGIDELEEINGYLDAMEISDDGVFIDLSIARGLDYYTGPVFEAILTDKKVAGFGSVMGGGRYDRLIEHFAGESVPATGASIGVDRLFSSMQKLGMIEGRPSTADVLVTVMDKDRIFEYQRIAHSLRTAGVKTELYMGKAKSIGKQLKYADRTGVPVAVIAGPDEFSKGEVSIKDLRVIRTKKVDIEDRKEYVEAKIGQKTVPAERLI
ncbi:MAG: histidine--tRNA ligase, partial [Candidatus Krumholzibacteria bacterium]|nr:histidine--tRNA ligase [Candidatus Krumholzibacteria bacterium]